MKEGSGSDRGANMKEGSAYRLLAREFFDTQFAWHETLKTYVGNIIDGRKMDKNDPYGVRDPFYVRVFLVVYVQNLHTFE